MVTKVLYESDLHDLKANEVLAALDGDPRLRFLPEADLLSLPVTKLAFTYGLAASNCEFRCTERYFPDDLISFFTSCCPTTRRNEGFVCQQPPCDGTPTDNSKGGSFG